MFLYIYQPKEHNTRHGGRGFGSHAHSDNSINIKDGTHYNTKDYNWVVIEVKETKNEDRIIARIITPDTVPF